MTMPHLSGRSCVLLALVLTACASASSDQPVSLPYVFRQRYNFAQSADCELLDIDHDGRNELLTSGRTAEGPYAITLSDLMSSGLQARWQFNLPIPAAFAGSADLDGDHRDELCFCLIEGRQLLLKVYDQMSLEHPRPSPRWITTVARLTDTNGDGKVNTGFMIVGTIDVNGDGHPDLIGQLNTAFDLTPRGVVAIDGQTGAILWSYLMGAWPTRVHVQDVTGDRQAAIVIGASAPGNGATANGTDDFHSYVIVLDRQGRLLWQHVLGEVSTEVLSAVADVNGDRTPEVITVLGGTGTGHGQISVWDGQTGHVHRTLNSPWTCSAIATADLNNDGREELLVRISRDRWWHWMSPCRLS